MIGTEVPVPGGAQEALASLQGHHAAGGGANAETHRIAWQQAELNDARQRTIPRWWCSRAEFDHHSVERYQPQLDALSHFIERQPA
ncbi:class II D-tagatose-bisphosphate aldolase, non-catalytic subunit [Serratia ureilytica]